MLLLSQVAVGDALPSLEVEVTPTTVVLGAIASRDWRPMHHDYKFATERNGVADIFLNTPNQAAWFERFVTDWTGATGRLGRITFRMKDSIFPGDRMVFNGTVTAVETDAVGCGWARLELSLSVGDRVCTTASISVAVPVTPTDNPWSRSGDQWTP
ncbi:MAG TPA: hypothetical protein DEG43_17460 [Acidimicrobiaceae bacterium]|jgi:acyl dehydratase|nr:hypothetical protein [Acidimicrobiaceae bacterium]